MVWEEVDRQSAVRAFRVVSPNGLQAEHWFETEPADGGTLLRHTIDGEALGEYEEIWRERIEPGHDRVIEALFDKIEATIQMRTRRPNSEHESSRWRIAEIAPDFRLEDVWTLPAQGGAEDFGALLEVMASLDPAHGESAATRLLFSIRYRLGGWFGWDEATRELAIPGNSKLIRLSPPLSHRRRVGRGTLEPDGSRRDASHLGRERRGPLSRTDGGVRQTSGQVRGGLHGTDQATSTPNRLPGADAADRTSLERQARTADRVTTSARDRRNRRSAHMPPQHRQPHRTLDRQACGASFRPAGSPCARPRHCRPSSASDTGQHDWFITSARHVGGSALRGRAGDHPRPQECRAS